MMSPRHSDFKILDVMASGNPPLGGPLYRAIGEGTLDDPGLTLILYTWLSSSSSLSWDVAGVEPLLCPRGDSGPNE